VETPESKCATNGKRSRNDDHCTRKTLPPFKEYAKNFDILAIVLPIHLQDQVLKTCGDKEVIIAQNKREIVFNPETGEEDKVVFNFAGWKRLVKIDIILEDW
jgi:hypothetical protein